MKIEKLFSVKGKVAVVSGGSRGIGEMITSAYLANGAKVYITARKTEACNAKAKELSDKYNAQCLSIPSDLSSLEGIEKFVSEIESCEEKIDILVNNAGVADFGKIETVKFKNWRKIMDTNLDGTFLTTQNVIKYLKKTKGNIINIASISGLRASTLRIAYGTSKAAIIQLTQQQAIELGEFGIRVNCVSPGPVKTKLAQAVHTPDIVKAYHDSIPLNRYGMENEIAEAIFFLSSEKASYITGQNLSVDGGFEASGVGLISLRES